MAAEEARVREGGERGGLVRGEILHRTENTRQEEKSVSRNSVNEAPFTASAAKMSCAF